MKYIGDHAFLSPIFNKNLSAASVDCACYVSVMRVAGV